MKKFFFSLLAIAAIASCAKTEDVYTEGETEIQLSPVTALSTKANVNGVIDGIVYPTKENFNVYAYWANEAAGSQFETAETYLNNVEFTNKGMFWGGTKTYYWPKNGSLRFAAYSPSSLSMAHYLASDVYELNGLTYPTDIAKSYDILVAPTTESYTAQTAAEKVSVVFEHALSWITFKLVSAEVANNVFTVTDVIVNDVNNHGNLVADMKADTKTWTTAMPQAITVFDKAKGTNVTTTPAIFENGGNTGTKFLVLPQATTTVTINFTQNAMEGTPKLENQTVTIPLTLADNDPWEAGKHYTYTVIFDLDEILINPSVEDWEEVTVPTIDATATDVRNSQELVEAVAAGRNVRLTEDINLEEPVIVDPTLYATRAGVVDVTVDLNGKTITAPLFTESNGAVTAGDTDSYAFWVKPGAKLTIVGDGVVKTQDCKYSIAVWADGGEVVINGGEYYNAGVGSDLIYAKNGGKVTINAGYFKACEKQAGVDGTNEKHSALNLHGSTTGNAITVYGGSFYGFDPANNVSENPAVNFCAAGYGSYELEENVWTVAAKTAEIQVNTEAALHDAAYHGANVILGADITVSETVVVEGNLVLNLFNHTITNKVDNTATDVFVVKGSLEVNGEGVIAAVTGNDGYAIISEGVVKLNNGTFTAGADANGAANAVVYARGEGKVYVNGGYFPNEYNSRYVLNKKDADKAKTVVEVKGGTYVGFNPAESLSETPQANFVAKGYKSILTAENTWTVVKE